MKRCPECDSTFTNNEKFCELDGTPLVADYAGSDPDSLVPPPDEGPEPDVQPEDVEAGEYDDVEAGEPEDVEAGEYDEVEFGEPEEVESVEYEDSRDRSPEQNWKTLAIVAVAGVAIGIVLFIVYHRLTRETPQQSIQDNAGSSNNSSNDALTQQQIDLLSSVPSPSADTSPAAEPSPSPSASARPTPTPAESPRVALSSSPVSTGGSARRGPVTIRLTDGTSVEVEEVWETGEGIWYRRRGLVTLLKRNQVRAIEQARTARPSPAPTAAASPSASP